MKLIFLFLLFLIFNISKQVIADQHKCDLCEGIVGIAEVLIEQNKSEEFIINDLEKLCNFIPQIQYKDSCIDLVSNYTKDIIQLIINREPAIKICQQIKICAASPSQPNKFTQNKEKVIINNEKELNSIKNEKNQDGNTLLCSICNLVVNKLVVYINSNKTIDEIENEMDEFCKLTFKNDPSQCEGFVEQYLPVLLQFIKSKEDPSKLCTKLKFCQSSSSSKLINNNKNINHNILSIKKNY